MNILKKPLAVLTAMVFALTVFSANTQIHAVNDVAGNDTVQVSIQGGVTLENRAWNENDQFKIVCQDINTGKEVTNDVATKDHQQFILNLQLEAGKTYYYQVKEEAPTEKNGIKYASLTKYFYITVDKDKKVTATDKQGNPWPIENGVIYASKYLSNFINHYFVEYSYLFAGDYNLVGKEYLENDKMTVEIYDVNKDEVLTSMGGYSSGSFQRGYSTTSHKPVEGEIFHFQIRMRQTNINSVILDSHVYDIKMKFEDDLKGHYIAYTSVDGSDFVKNSDIKNLNFTNTYFTRAVSITDEIDKTAAYDLYRYTSGTASKDNTSKELLANISLDNGTYTNKLEEGKYFLVKKESGTLYSFDVTKENYQTPYQLVVKKSIDPIKPEVEKPVAPSNPKDETKTPQTGDSTNMMSYIILLGASILLGICVFVRKKTIMHS